MRQVSSGGTNHNNFLVDFYRHAIKTSKVGPKFFKFQSTFIHAIRATVDRKKGSMPN